MDGEAAILTKPPKPPFHAVRAEGGPGNLDLLRPAIAVAPLLAPPCVLGSSAPKSLTLAIETISSTGRFPSDEAALLSSGLVDAFRLRGRVELSSAVELVRLLALLLREGILLAAVRMMGRASLLSCETEEEIGWMSTLVSPASGAADLQASLDALCCTKAARKENLDEHRPLNPEPILGCVCAAALRFGEDASGVSFERADMASFFFDASLRPCVAGRLRRW